MEVRPVVNSAGDQEGLWGTTWGFHPRDLVWTGVTFLRGAGVGMNNGAFTSQSRQQRATSQSPGSQKLKAPDLFLTQ